MDLSLLPWLGLVALLVAMAIIVFDMRDAMKPATCPECLHCQTNAGLAAARQERLNREYARRIGVDRADDENDDHRIG